MAARPTNATSPVVFLSYSRTDRALADRLLADLEQAGHPCWLDTTDIPGGEVWIAAIASGLERAYAVVTLVSESANRSEWVRLEFLHAKQLGKPVIPLLTQDCRLPWYMADRQAIPIEPDYDTGLGRLLAALTKPITPVMPTESQQRQAELAYLRRLQLGELVHTELYTPMAGVAKLNPKAQASAPLPAVVMRPEFRHLCRITTHADEPSKPPRNYDDILLAYREVRRAALLGEPGAGKTTTLWKLARDAVELALADPSAALPLLVRLGKWTTANEPLADFMARELGELGAYLEPLLKTRRAVLLLDGLNEVPSGEREAKAALVKSFLATNKDLPALISCRELDYTGALDLGLDTVTIRPLDPPRILDFVTSYLSQTDSVDPPTALCKGGLGGFHKTNSVSGRQRGENLFWRLAGGDAVREVWRVWEKAGASLALFWSAQDIPQSEPDIYHQTSGVQSQIWRKAVHDPRSLMRLAGNPYLLYMLTQVYIGSGELPANRALLFDGFVQVLLLREHLAEDTEAWRTTTEGAALLDGLEKLAWALQSRRKSWSGDAEATTVMSRAEVAAWLEDRLLYRAAAASLLDVGERHVRFTHQLLQEYFTARMLRSRLEQGGLDANAVELSVTVPSPNGGGLGWGRVNSTALGLDAQSLWPRCWERTGWEEAAVLLAGFYADDCTPVIDWLADTQPEVAAQCILNSGAHTPIETLKRLRQDWISRLTDLTRHPEPDARAAFGRSLAMLTIDGEPLDNRPGLALRYEAKLRRQFPDIAWVEVPAGPFIYQDGETLTLHSFHIARYPVTHGQFQAFIDDPEGFANPQWWEGLAERFEQPHQPEWYYSNYPRETVSWYASVAYCRWLSRYLGFEIRLPTEQEWEKAARGLKGFTYPWGDGFNSDHANINEPWGDVGPHYLKQTTAVGIYPQGQSPYGVLDMAGNVWEWCLNEYDQPERQSLEGDVWRAVRGGSWLNNQDCARTTFRSYGHPGNRLNNLGFRVVVLRSPPVV